MKTVLTISAKCSDLCDYSLRRGNKILVEKDGYVPHDLGIGGGDYVEFSVDLATGQILNWKPPTEEQIQAAVKGECCPDCGEEWDDCDCEEEEKFDADAFDRATGLTGEPVIEEGPIEVWLCETCSKSAESAVLTSTSEARMICECCHTTQVVHLFRIEESNA